MELGAGRALCVASPLQDLPINGPYLARTYTECEQWRGEILSRLEKERPQLIILDMVRRYGADFGLFPTPRRGLTA